MGSLHALRRTAPVDRTPQDEAVLVERCRDGDRGALGIVLSEHAEALERHVTCLVGPGADVEDILQQTFLAVITAFARFRGEAKIRTWLTRIATHVAIDALRKPARRRRTRASVDLDARPCRDAAPDDVSESRRQLERVRVLLDALTPLRRVAFILHAIEGRSIEETAALMDASVTATKSRVFWARRTLLRRARRDPMLAERFGGGS